MIVTKVQYTVKPGYAARNTENIRRVIDEVRSLERSDITYSVFIQEDGKTFVHRPMFADEGARVVFSALESFKKFRSELEASRTDVPPVTVNLTLLDAVGNIQALQTNIKR